MSAESGLNGNGHNGRLPTGQFRPGHTLGGRPRGGTKQVGRLRRALEEAADPEVVGKVMAMLAEIALSPNEDIKVRLHAGEAYLDRCVGRPRQTLEVESDPVAERLEEIRDAFSRFDPTDVKTAVLTFLNGGTPPAPPMNGNGFNSD